MLHIDTERVINTIGVLLHIDTERVINTIGVLLHIDTERVINIDTTGSCSNNTHFYQRNYIGVVLTAYDVNFDYILNV